MYGMEGSSMKDKIIEMHPSDPERQGWVPVKCDGCRWILDLPGGPFAVLPCDVCNVPVEIYFATNEAHHKVECPKCGKHTPEVMGGQLLDVLRLWNEMVGRG
jgi:LSD1 subclass zinc finger protein